MANSSNLALVPSVSGDSRSVSSVVRNFRASLSRPISTNSQVDATLSKELKIAVKSVAPRVVAALKSCQAVESIVEELEVSKRSNDEESLLATWKAIINDFRLVLANSRQAAIAGATQAQEISSHLLPYLFDEGVPLADKQKEIGSFKKSVEMGRKAANDFSITLEHVVDRISTFKAMGSGRVGRVAEELMARIAELEMEVHGLAESIQRAKKQIAKSQEKKQHIADEKLHKSELQTEMKDAQKEKEKRLQSGKEVAKHTQRINAETDGLIVVWNLISDDVSNIKNYLDLLSMGDSKDLFKARLEKLPGQYKELEGSLRKYASGLSHRVEPGSKPERSLNPFKLLLR